jgi:3-isopropylmalate dehydratase small subunit
MKCEGNVWKFGDHVDTDVIIPARFLNVWDKQTLAENCFVDVRDDFHKAVQQGDIIVAGTNFGCGSSREHAPLALKEAGISLVVAGSFARIFYRNSFNIGLPLLESRKACEVFEEGDRIVVDLGSGEIKKGGAGSPLMAKPIPDFMMKIVEAGGMVEYLKAGGTL